MRTTVGPREGAAEIRLARAAAQLTILDYFVYYNGRARPERHSIDRILDVSRDLVLRDGARGVTVDRIVAASGAPKGSMYYRFSTVNDLLAAMWLRAVRRSQARFLEPLGWRRIRSKPPLPPAWPFTTSPRGCQNNARLLAALRRENLVGEVMDAALAVLTSGVNDPMHAALTAFAHDGSTGGRPETPSSGRRFAVVDLPQGAIRRHLVGGSCRAGQCPGPIAAAMRAALSGRPDRPRRMLPKERPDG